ncbi:uncharacterized protein LOC124437779 [Xenia sp. Carnegie-2017]|uniref:uncharacterized protein LOC124437779 n=1 Tax=Xenia sp. Carnegie-2017 TaxID=2897299 RepID=UPI001F039342|nr:uncharacterized protein LOC124437779 [Xenia sp. Carnegie-2017]
MNSSSSKPILTNEEEGLLEKAKYYIKQNGLDGKINFLNDQLDAWEKLKLNFAVTGSNNSGKSSFINAFTGLKACEQEASPNDLSALGATNLHFKYKNVELWDLPGIGTPENPNLETYCRNIGDLQKYDAFLIFSKSRFTENEMQLVKKVSKELHRPFLCLHTYAHIDIKNAEEVDGLLMNKETAMEEIKKCCFNNLKGLVNDETDIYVIDNNDMEKCNFDCLSGEVILKLLKCRKDYFLNCLNHVIFKNEKLTDEERLLAEAVHRVKKHGLIDFEDFIRDQIESWENTEINLAITGDSGTGKSSFINAMRGLKAYEKGAAPVDVTEVKILPTEYVYPEKNNVKMWDLPGFGSIEYSNLSEYFKKMNMESYDAILIFCKTRFTNYDKELAKEVSKELKRPFFFVRTNIHQDLINAQEDKGPQFDETSVLEKIKNDCFENLKGLIHDENDIFLIDNKVTDKYDFDRLRGDVVSKLLERRSESFLQSLNYVMYGKDTISEDEKRIAQIKDYVEHHGISGIEDFYHCQISSLKDTEINLAITGNSGTGKSSFINAVRGLKAHHVGAAPVGTEEVTIKPTKYTSQKHENIIFWDLPGIGTPKHPNLKDYCKNVGGLEKYDAFLIFYKTRFTQYDKELAEKVLQDLSIKKPLFFIRTNIDTEIKNTKDDEGPNFNEKSALDKMKTDCLNNLKGLINNKNEVFLIDNKFTDKYDFNRLIESISDALPHRKMECFNLSIDTVTRESIKRKANLLKARATKLAGAKSKRVSKDGPVFNIVVVWNEVSFYCHQFGLPIVGSDKFKALKKKSSDVILKYSSINLETLVKDYGMNSDFITFPWTETLLESWYGRVHEFLSKCINDLEKVALNIWDATVINSPI